MIVVQHFRARRFSQRGMTMIVGMIMLLLLTVIGLAGINAANMEERMSGNQRDRALAFQSSEAGLRAGESVLNGLGALPVFDGTVQGYGPQVASSGSADFWGTFDWSGNGKQTALGLTGIKSEPRYYIEQVETQFPADTGSSVEYNPAQDDSITVYRVTSRAVGASADTVVILQSTYKR